MQKGGCFHPPFCICDAATGNYAQRLRGYLPSAAQWHGVTYKEDKPALVASIEKMIAEGKYPRNLWA